MGTGAINTACLPLRIGAINTACPPIGTGAINTARPLTGTGATSMAHLPTGIGAASMAHLQGPPHTHTLEDESTESAVSIGQDVRFRTDEIWRASGGPGTTAGPTVSLMDNRVPPTAQLTDMHVYLPRSIPHPLLAVLPPPARSLMLL